MERCIELFEEKKEIEREQKQRNKTIAKIEKDSKNKIEKEKKILNKKSKRKAIVDAQIKKEYEGVKKIINEII